VIRSTILHHEIADRLDEWSTLPRGFNTHSWNENGCSRGHRHLKKDYILKDHSHRWKRLAAGASRLELNVIKANVDRLELVRKYLDQVINIFPSEDKTPEGMAIYHLASVLKDSLQDLDVLDVALPEIGSDHYKIFEEDIVLDEIKPLDLSSLLHDARTCPFCGSSKKKV
jgi:hypothetical protein